MDEYNRKRNLFRYFKQASLAEYPWKSEFDSNLLCVWYLTYVIFLLEDMFPDGFSLNMGVPTDDKTFNQKRELGTRMLASAIYIVEEVYCHDLRKFLNEKVEDLKRNTELMDFSEDIKEEYRINIFPEAYVSLIGLTSRGKLSEGMSLNADIGGGTTDISFFIVNKGIPKIYRYWSLPCGLNYIAEQSGFNYAEGGFELKAHDDVVKKYNKKKEDLGYDLVMELLAQLRTYTKIPKSNLRNALQNRIVVYNGGGSTYPALTTEIYHFSDVKIANSDLWTEEIIRDRSKVIKLANLLTTAFGLSVAESDNEVTLCDFDTLFAKTGSENGDDERQEIDKDVC
jgi:rRNA maturation protein Rpf1